MRSDQRHARRGIWVARAACAGVALAACAGGLGSVGAAWAGPPPVVGGQDVGVASAGETVGLITGDVVNVASDGMVRGVVPGPRPDGSVPRFAVFAVRGHWFVVPSDVQALFGNGLDRALFDVTALDSSGQGRELTVPVFVTGALAASPDRTAALGLTVDARLSTLVALTGSLDTTTSSGPARAWQLLSAVRDDQEPAMAQPRVGTTSPTQVWLDEHYALAQSRTSAPARDLLDPVWMATIGADGARQQGMDGHGVVVGVVDSGIDDQHPDLAGQVIASKDFTGSGTTSDEFGHGTFVASEIAGTGAASDGRYAGVAPGSRLVNAKVLDSAGFGSDSATLAGIEWAAQQGASVINISLVRPGVYDNGSSFFDQFVDAVAREYDCLIVAAAGNDGTPQTVSSPATADEALAVGATLEDGSLAWFSSTGPRRGDGAVAPQVMAPGAGRLVLDESGNPIPSGMGWETTGLVGAGAGTDGYATVGWLGTSMAVPLVSGAAAVLKEAQPQLDRDELKARLESSARALPDGSRVFEQGAGLIDVRAALAQTLVVSPAVADLGGLEPPYPSMVTQTISYRNNAAVDETITLTASDAFAESQGKPVEDAVHGGTGAMPSAPNQARAQRSAAAAAVPGVADVTSADVTLSTDRLVVPAAGTASVDLTIDTSAVAIGYVGGYVTATTSQGADIRMPFGLAMLPETHALTIRATDRMGVALDQVEVYSDLVLLNLDTGETQFLTPHEGEATARLERGRYLVAGNAIGTTASGGLVETMLLGSPIDLTKDMTLVLDGERTQPVTVQSNRPSEGHLSVEATFSAADGTALYGQYADQAVDSAVPAELYVTTVPATALGTWGLTATATLTQPYVEAAFDACGGSPAASADVGGAWPLGRSSVSLVPVDPSAIAPAPGPSYGAVLRWDHPDPRYGDLAAVVGWIDQVASAGYSALVVASDQPGVAEPTARLAYSVSNAGATGSTGLPFLITGGPAGDRLRASAGPGANTLHILRRETPDYAYVLMGQADVTRDAPVTLIGSPGSTAALTIEHRLTGAQRYAVDTFTNGGPIGEVDVAVPSSYVVYLSPGVEWGVRSSLGLARDAAPTTIFESPARGYAAGENGLLAFGSQTHAFGLGASPESAITRAGDQLSGSIPGLVDGQGHFEVDPAAVDSGFADVTFTLTDADSGETLASADPGSGVAGFTAVIPPTPTQSLLMTESLATAGADWAVSTHIAASWAWTVRAPDTADTADVVQPLRSVWFEVPGLDAHNQGSTSQTVVLHLSQQPGSMPAPVKEVSLSASEDGGATWIPIGLNAQAPPRGDADGGSYAGVVEAAQGSSVAFRASASGAGSTLTETIMDAYVATGSPIAFPAPVTWPNCHPDPTGGATPNITRTASGATPGTAVPGVRVTVAGPAGASATGVADGSASLVMSGRESILVETGGGAPPAATTSFFFAAALLLIGSAALARVMPAMREVHRMRAWHRPD